MSAARSRAAVEEMLLGKLGATAEKGKDHGYYVISVDGKLAARTKVSTGSRYGTLGSDLIALMARQCHVSNMQFLSLVDCSMSREDWIAHLRSSGYIL